MIGQTASSGDKKIYVILRLISEGRQKDKNNVFKCGCTQLPPLLFLHWALALLYSALDFCQLLRKACTVYSQTNTI